MNKKLPLIVLSSIAVAAGGYFYLEKPGNAQAPKNAQTSSQPVTVEAVKVTTGSVERVAEAVGTLTSNESVILRPEITGRITGIIFEEGQPVKKDMPLVQLDDVIAKAELAQMKTSLDLSQTNFERANRLFEKDAESGQVRDEALAKRNTDRAGYDLAKARLDKTTIRAPFDGVAGLRKVSLGDFVNPGQDLVNIESIDPMKVDFRLPEMYLSALKQGQSIQVAVDAFPERKFAGEVYAIDPLVDANGRTIVLRAKLPNPDRVLRPGLFARVQVVLGQNDKAMLVPEEAIVPQSNKQFVYKVEGDKPIMTEIETGIRRNGQVEVIKGLSLNDMVITAGQMKLRPNSSVKIAQNPAVRKPE